MIMSIFLRPKDHKAGFKVLVFQFFSVTMVCVVALAIALLRVNLQVGWLVFFLIGPYCLLWWLAIKLRRMAAALKPEVRRC